MSKYIWIIIYIGLLGGVGECYELMSTRTLSQGLNITYYSISDNLDAVVVVDKTTPTFIYQTFYPIGYADELGGEQGRIHFLEHLLLYQGRKTMSEIHSDNEGTTSYHFMNLRLSFTKDKLDRAIKIDQERFFTPKINDAILDREKQVILAERSLRLANSKRTSWNAFLGLVFGMDNFEPIGSIAFIQQLEAKDLLAFFEKNLRNRKRLVVVIGDVKPSEVAEKLDQAFRQGHNLKMIPENRQPARPAALGKTFTINSNMSSAIEVYMSWYVADLNNRDYAALLILSNILNASSNSLRASLFDSGQVRTFISEVKDYRGFCLLSIVAELSLETSPEDVTKKIQATLAAIKSEGFSENEFLKARNQLLRQQYSQFYDPSQLAYEIGRSYSHGRGPMAYVDLLQVINTVEKEDVFEIIGRVLKDENAITAIGKLESNHKKLSSEIYVIFVFCIVITLCWWRGRGLLAKLTERK